LFRYRESGERDDIGDCYRKVEETEATLEKSGEGKIEIWAREKRR
jgi:hypothetical protein